MAQENRVTFSDQCFEKLAHHLNDKKTIYGFKKAGERSISVKELFTEESHLEKAGNFFLSINPENLQKVFKKYPYPKVWKGALENILNKENGIDFNDFQKIVLLAQAIKKHSPRLLKDPELQIQYEQKISEFADKIEGAKENTIFHVVSKTIKTFLFDKKTSSQDKKNFDSYVDCVKNSQNIESLLNNKSIKQCVIFDSHLPASLREKIDEFRNKNPLENKGNLLGKGSYNEVYGLSEKRVVRVSTEVNKKFPSEALPESIYVVKRIIQQNDDENGEYEIFKKYRSGNLQNLRAQEAFSEEAFLQVAYSAMRGVKVLCDAGIAHHDLKESNFLCRTINGMTLAAVADTDGCQFFDPENENQPLGEITYTPSYALNASKIHETDSKKHVNYSLLITFLRIYLPEGKPKDDLLSFMDLYAYFHQSDNIRNKRDEAVNEAIGSIDNPLIKEFLTKLKDESLEEALNSECFNGVREKFEVIENKEKDKIKKYKSLEKEPEGKGNLKIQQRSFQKLIQDAEKIINTATVFSAEMERWREEAKIILEKNKGDFEVANLVNEAERRIILLQERELKFIELLSKGIKEEGPLKGFYIKGEKLHASDLLNNASEENAKFFFKDLILNISPKKLRKLLQEEDYRIDLGL